MKKIAFLLFVFAFIFLNVADAGVARLAAKGVKKSAVGSAKVVKFAAHVARKVAW